LSYYQDLWKIIFIKKWTNCSATSKLCPNEPEMWKLVDSSMTVRLYWSG